MSEKLKTCPDCAESVKDAARKCRYCGYEFVGQSIDDLSPTLPEPAQNRAPQGSVGPPRTLSTDGDVSGQESSQLKSPPKAWPAVPRPRPRSLIFKVAAGTSLGICLTIGLIVVVVGGGAWVIQNNKGNKASQDSIIRSNVRIAAINLQACGSEQYSAESPEREFDFSDCDATRDVDGVKDKDGPKMGSNEGEVEVKTAGVGEFSIVGHSKTGNDFRFSYSANGSTFVCHSFGTAGCPASGDWGQEY